MAQLTRQGCVRVEPASADELRLLCGALHLLHGGIAGQEDNYDTLALTPPVNELIQEYYAQAMADHDAQLAWACNTWRARCGDHAALPGQHSPTIGTADDLEEESPLQRALRALQASAQPQCMTGPTPDDPAPQQGSIGARWLLPDWAALQLAIDATQQVLDMRSGDAGASQTSLHPAELHSAAAAALREARHMLGCHFLARGLVAAILVGGPRAGVHLPLRSSQPPLEEEETDSTAAAPGAAGSDSAAASGWFWGPAWGDLEAYRQSLTHPPPAPRVQLSGWRLRRLNCIELERCMAQADALCVYAGATGAAAPGSPHDLKGSPASRSPNGIPVPSGEPSAAAALPLTTECAALLSAAGLLIRLRGEAAAGRWGAVARILLPALALAPGPSSPSTAETDSPDECADDDFTLGEAGAAFQATRASILASLSLCSERLLTAGRPVIQRAASFSSLAPLYAVTVAQLPPVAVQEVAAYGAAVDTWILGQLWAQWGHAAGHRKASSSGGPELPGHVLDNTPEGPPAIAALSSRSLLPLVALARDAASCGAYWCSVSGGSGAAWTWGFALASLLAPLLHYAEQGDAAAVLRLLAAAGAAPVPGGSSGMMRKGSAGLLAGGAGHMGEVAFEHGCRFLWRWARSALFIGCAASALCGDAGLGGDRGSSAAGLAAHSSLDEAHGGAAPWETRGDADVGSGPASHTVNTASAADADAAREAAEAGDLTIIASSYGEGAGTAAAAAAKQTTTPNIANSSRVVEGAGALEQQLQEDEAALRGLYYGPPFAALFAPYPPPQQPVCGCSLEGALSLGRQLLPRPDAPDNEAGDDNYYHDDATGALSVSRALSLSPDGLRQLEYEAAALLWVAQTAYGARECCAQGRFEAAAEAAQAVQQWLDSTAQQQRESSADGLAGPLTPRGGIQGASPAPAHWRASVAGWCEAIGRWGALSAVVAALRHHLRGGEDSNGLRGALEWEGLGEIGSQGEGYWTQGSEWEAALSHLSGEVGTLYDEALVYLQSGLAVLSAAAVSGELGEGAPAPAAPTPALCPWHVSLATVLQHAGLGPLWEGAGPSPAPAQVLLLRDAGSLLATAALLREVRGRVRGLRALLQKGVLGDADDASIEEGALILCGADSSLRGGANDTFVFDETGAEAAGSPPLQHVAGAIDGLLALLGRVTISTGEGAVALVPAHQLQQLQGSQHLLLQQREREGQQEHQPLHHQMEQYPHLSASPSRAAAAVVVEDASVGEELRALALEVLDLRVRVVTAAALWRLAQMSPFPYVDEGQPPFSAGPTEDDAATLAAADDTLRVAVAALAAAVAPSSDTPSAYGIATGDPSPATQLVISAGIAVLRAVGRVQQASHLRLMQWGPDGEAVCIASSSFPTGSYPSAQGQGPPIATKSTPSNPAPNPEARYTDPEVRRVVRADALVSVIEALQQATEAVSGDLEQVAVGPQVALPVDLPARLDVWLRGLFAAVTAAHARAGLRCAAVEGTPTVSTAACSSQSTHDSAPSRTGPSAAAGSGAASPNELPGHPCIEVTGRPCIEVTGHPHVSGGLPGVEALALAVVEAQDAAGALGQLLEGTWTEGRVSYRHEPFSAATLPCWVAAAQRGLQSCTSAASDLFQLRSAVAMGDWEGLRGSAVRAPAAPDNDAGPLPPLVGGGETTARRCDPRLQCSAHARCCCSAPCIRCAVEEERAVYATELRVRDAAAVLTRAVLGCGAQGLPGALDFSRCDAPGTRTDLTRVSQEIRHIGAGDLGARGIHLAPSPRLLSLLHTAETLVGLREEVRVTTGAAVAAPAPPSEAHEALVALEWRLMLLTRSLGPPSPDAASAAPPSWALPTPRGPPTSQAGSAAATEAALDDAVGPAALRPAALGAADSPVEAAAGPLLSPICKRELGLLLAHVATVRVVGSITAVLGTQGAPPTVRQAGAAEPIPSVRQKGGEGSEQRRDYGAEVAAATAAADLRLEAALHSARGAGLGMPPILSQSFQLSPALHLDSDPPVPATPAAVDPHSASLIASADWLARFRRAAGALGLGGGGGSVRGSPLALTELGLEQSSLEFPPHGPGSLGPWSSGTVQPPLTAPVPLSRTDRVAALSLVVSLALEVEPHQATREALVRGAQSLASLQQAIETPGSESPLSVLPVAGPHSTAPLTLHSLVASAAAPLLRELSTLSATACLLTALGPRAHTLACDPHTLRIAREGISLLTLGTAVNDAGVLAPWKSAPLLPASSSAVTSLLSLLQAGDDAAATAAGGSSNDTAPCGTPHAPSTTIRVLLLLCRTLRAVRAALLQEDGDALVDALTQAESVGLLGALDLLPTGDVGRGVVVNQTRSPLAAGLAGAVEQALRRCCSLDGKHASDEADAEAHDTVGVLAPPSVAIHSRERQPLPPGPPIYTPSHVSHTADARAHALLASVSAELLLGCREAASALAVCSIQTALEARPVRGLTAATAAAAAAGSHDNIELNSSCSNDGLDPNGLEEAEHGALADGVPLVVPHASEPSLARALRELESSFAAPASSDEAQSGSTPHRVVAFASGPLSAVASPPVAATEDRAGWTDAGTTAFAASLHLPAGVSPLLLRWVEAARFMGQARAALRRRDWGQLTQLLLLLPPQPPLLGRPQPPSPQVQLPLSPTASLAVGLSLPLSTELRLIARAAMFHSAVAGAAACLLYRRAGLRVFRAHGTQGRPASQLLLRAEGGDPGAGVSPVAEAEACLATLDALLRGLLEASQPARPGAAPLPTTPSRLPGAGVLTPAPTPKPPPSRPRGSSLRHGSRGRSPRGQGPRQRQSALGESGSSISSANEGLQAVVQPPQPPHPPPPRPRAPDHRVSPSSGASLTASYTANTATSSSGSSGFGLRVTPRRLDAGYGGPAPSTPSAPAASQQQLLLLHDSTEAENPGERASNTAPSLSRPTLSPLPPYSLPPAFRRRWLRSLAGLRAAALSLLRVRTGLRDRDWGAVTDAAESALAAPVELDPWVCRAVTPPPPAPPRIGLAHQPEDDDVAAAALLGLCLPTAAIDGTSLNPAASPPAPVGLVIQLAPTLQHAYSTLSQQQPNNTSEEGGAFTLEEAFELRAAAALVPRALAPSEGPVSPLSSLIALELHLALSRAVSVAVEEALTQPFLSSAWEAAAGADGVVAAAGRGSSPSFSASFSSSSSASPLLSPAPRPDPPPQPLLLQLPLRPFLHLLRRAVGSAEVMLAGREHAVALTLHASWLLFSARSACEAAGHWACAEGAEGALGDSGPGEVAREHWASVVLATHTGAQAAEEAFAAVLSAPNTAIGAGGGGQQQRRTPTLASFHPLTAPFLASAYRAALTAIWEVRMRGALADGSGFRVDPEFGYIGAATAPDNGTGDGETESPWQLPGTAAIVTAATPLLSAAAAAGLWGAAATPHSPWGGYLSRSPMRPLPLGPGSPRTAPRGNSAPVTPTLDRRSAAVQEPPTAPTPVPLAAVIFDPRETRLDALDAALNGPGLPDPGGSARGGPVGTGRYDGQQPLRDCPPLGPGPPALARLTHACRLLSALRGAALAGAWGVVLEMLEEERGRFVGAAGGRGQGLFSLLEGGNLLPPQGPTLPEGAVQELRCFSQEAALRLWLERALGCICGAAGAILQGVALITDTAGAIMPTLQVERALMLQGGVALVPPSPLAPLPLSLGLPVALAELEALLGAVGEAVLAPWVPEHPSVTRFDAGSALHSTHRNGTPAGDASTPAAVAAVGPLASLQAAATTLLAPSGTALPLTPDTQPPTVLALAAAAALGLALLALGRRCVDLQGSDAQSSPLFVGVHSGTQRHGAGTPMRGAGAGEPPPAPVPATPQRAAAAVLSAAEGLATTLGILGNGSQPGHGTLGVGLASVPRVLRSSGPAAEGALARVCEAVGALLLRAHASALCDSLCDAVGTPPHLLLPPHRQQQPDTPPHRSAAAPPALEEAGGDTNNSRRGRVAAGDAVGSPPAADALRRALASTRHSAQRALGLTAAVQRAQGAEEGGLASGDADGGPLGPLRVTLRGALELGSGVQAVWAGGASGADASSVAGAVVALERVVNCFCAASPSPVAPASPAAAAIGLGLGGGEREAAARGPPSTAALLFPPLPLAELALAIRGAIIQPFSLCLAAAALCTALGDSELGAVVHWGVGARSGATPRPPLLTDSGVATVPPPLGAGDGDTAFGEGRHQADSLSTLRSAVQAASTLLARAEKRGRGQMLPTPALQQQQQQNDSRHQPPPQRGGAPPSNPHRAQRPRQQHPESHPPLPALPLIAAMRDLGEGMLALRSAVVSGALDPGGKMPRGRRTPLVPLLQAALDAASRAGQLWGALFGDSAEKDEASVAPLRPGAPQLHLSPALQWVRSPVASALRGVQGELAAVHWALESAALSDKIFAVLRRGLLSLTPRARHEGPAHLPDPNSPPGEQGQPLAAAADAVARAPMCFVCVPAALELARLVVSAPAAVPPEHRSGELEGLLRIAVALAAALNLPAPPAGDPEGDPADGAVVSAVSAAVWFGAPGQGGPGASDSGTDDTALPPTEAALTLLCQVIAGEPGPSPPPATVAAAAAIAASTLAIMQQCRREAFLTRLILAALSDPAAAVCPPASSPQVSTFAPAPSTMRADEEAAGALWALSFFSLVGPGPAGNTALEGVVTLVEEAQSSESSGSSGGGPDGPRTTSSVHSGAQPLLIQGSASGAWAELGRAVLSMRTVVGMMCQLHQQLQQQQGGSAGEMHLSPALSSTGKHPLGPQEQLISGGSSLVQELVGKARRVASLLRGLLASLARGTATAGSSAQAPYGTVHGLAPGVPDWSAPEAPEASSTASPTSAPEAPASLRAPPQYACPWPWGGSVAHGALVLAEAPLTVTPARLRGLSVVSAISAGPSVEFFDAEGGSGCTLAEALLSEAAAVERASLTLQAAEALLGALVPVPLPAVTVHPSHPPSAAALIRGLDGARRREPSAIAPGHTTELHGCLPGVAAGGLSLVFPDTPVLGSPPPGTELVSTPGKQSQQLQQLQGRLQAAVRTHSECVREGERALLQLRKDAALIGGLLQHTGRSSDSGAVAPNPGPLARHTPAKGRSPSGPVAATPASKSSISARRQQALDPSSWVQQQRRPTLSPAGVARLLSPLQRGPTRASPTVSDPLSAADEALSRWLRALCALATAAAQTLPLLGAVDARVATLHAAEAPAKSGDHSPFALYVQSQQWLRRLQPGRRGADGDADDDDEEGAGTDDTVAAAVAQLRGFQRCCEGVEESAAGAVLALCSAAAALDQSRVDDPEQGAATPLPPPLLLLPGIAISSAAAGALARYSRVSLAPFLRTAHALFLGPLPALLASLWTEAYAEGRREGGAQGLLLLRGRGGAATALRAALRAGEMLFHVADAAPSDATPASAVDDSIRWAGGPSSPDPTAAAAHSQSSFETVFALAALLAGMLEHGARAEWSSALRSLLPGGNALLPLLAGVRVSPGGRPGPTLPLLPIRCAAALLADTASAAAWHARVEREASGVLAAIHHPTTRRAAESRPTATTGVATATTGVASGEEEEEEGGGGESDDLGTGPVDTLVAGLTEFAFSTAPLTGDPLGNGRSQSIAQRDSSPGLAPLLAPPPLLPSLCERLSSIRISIGALLAASSLPPSIDSDSDSGQSNSSLAVQLAAIQALEMHAHRLTTELGGGGGAAAAPHFQSLRAVSAAVAELLRVTRIQAPLRAGTLGILAAINGALGGRGAVGKAPPPSEGDCGGNVPHSHHSRWVESGRPSPMSGDPSCGHPSLCSLGPPCNPGESVVGALSDAIDVAAAALQGAEGGTYPYAQGPAGRALHLGAAASATRLALRLGCAVPAVWRAVGLCALSPDPTTPGGGAVEDDPDPRGDGMLPLGALAHSLQSLLDEAEAVEAGEPEDGGEDASDPWVQSIRFLAGQVMRRCVAPARTALVCDLLFARLWGALESGAGAPALSSAAAAAVATTAGAAAEEGWDSGIGAVPWAFVQACIDSSPITTQELLELLQLCDAFFADALQGVQTAPPPAAAAGLAEVPGTSESDASRSAATGETAPRRVATGASSAPAPPPLFTPVEAVGQGSAGGPFTPVEAVPEAQRPLLTHLQQLAACAAGVLALRGALEARDVPAAAAAAVQLLSSTHATSPATTPVPSGLPSPHPLIPPAVLGEARLVLRALGVAASAHSASARLRSSQRSMSEPELRDALAPFLGARLPASLLKLRPVGPGPSGWVQQGGNGLLGAWEVGGAASPGAQTSSGLYSIVEAALEAAAGPATAAEQAGVTATPSTGKSAPESDVGGSRLGFLLSPPQDSSGAHPLSTLGSLLSSTLVRLSAVCEAGAALRTAASSAPLSELGEVIAAARTAGFEGGALAAAVVALRVLAVAAAAVPEAVERVDAARLGAALGAVGALGYGEGEGGNSPASTAPASLSLASVESLLARLELQWPPHPNSPVGPTPLPSAALLPLEVLRILRLPPQDRAAEALQRAVMRRDPASATAATIELKTLALLGTSGAAGETPPSTLLPLTPAQWLLSEEEAQGADARPTPSLQALLQECIAAGAAQRLYPLASCPVLRSPYDFYSAAASALRSGGGALLLSAGSSSSVNGPGGQSVAEEHTALRRRFPWLCAPVGSLAQGLPAAITTAAASAPGGASLSHAAVAVSHAIYAATRGSGGLEMAGTAQQLIAVALTRPELRDEVLLQALCACREAGEDTGGPLLLAQRRLQGLVAAAEAEPAAAATASPPPPQGTTHLGSPAAQQLLHALLQALPPSDAMEPYVEAFLRARAALAREPLLPPPAPQHRLWVGATAAGAHATSDGAEAAAARALGLGPSWAAMLQAMHEAAFQEQL